MADFNQQQAFLFMPDISGFTKFVNETEIDMLHSNEFLYGYGLGLDFVTYYDIVFRVEFSANKFGETGLFLHFNAPF